MSNNSPEINVNTSETFLRLGIPPEDFAKIKGEFQRDLAELLGCSPEEVSIIRVTKVEPPVEGDEELYIAGPS